MVRNYPLLASMIAIGGIIILVINLTSKLPGLLFWPLIIIALVLLIWGLIGLALHLWIRKKEGW